MFAKITSALSALHNAIAAILGAATANIDTNEIEGEFDALSKFDNDAFLKFKSKHSERQSPAYLHNWLYILLCFSALGVPGSAIVGLLKQETAYFFGAAFWLTLAIPIYAYLANAARYWREHYAIQREQMRRFRIGTLQ
jgi:hypothetical protein